MIWNCGDHSYIDSSNGTVTEIYGCGIETCAFTPAEYTVTVIRNARFSFLSNCWTDRSGLL